MAKCIINKSMFGDVKIAKVDPKNQANGKPMSFDITKISNTMVYEIFFGDSQREVLKELKKIVQNPKIYKKMVDEINLMGKNNVLLKDLAPTTDAKEKSQIGNTLKFRAVALKEVLGAISSESDVNQNLGISDNTLQNSLINADGSRNINLIAVAQSIGKILMNQKGHALVGEATEVNYSYGNIGMVALEELASDEVNLIDIYDNASILNPDFKNENLKSISRKRGSKALVIKGFPVVSINTKVLMSPADARSQENVDEMNKSLDDGDLNALYEFDVAEETVSSANAITRMLTPSNVKAPMTPNEATTEGNEPKIKDLGQKGEDTPGIVQQHEDILNMMQKRRQKINPSMNAFMMNMHNTWKDMAKLDEADPDATLKRIYEAVGITSSAVQHKIFGAFVGSTADNFESEIGRSISKENPLLQLIMYYPNLVDNKGNSRNFHHQLGVYRTTRIEFLSTFLNEHTDKNFARAVIQGDPVTIDENTVLGRSMANQMLHSILDETKLDIEQIVNPGFDPALEQLIERYKTLFIEGNDPVAQATFMNDLAKNTTGRNMRNAKAPGFTGNVFTTMAVLEALSNIRDGQKTGEPVRTAYRTKLDAATSGVTLTFAQNAGKDVTTSDPEDKVLKIFKELGYTKDMIGKDPELADAYHILLRSVESASTRIDDPDLVTFQVMTDLARLKIFNNVRELAKPMTMVTNYQAGDDTAVLSTSKELTESVTDYLMSGNTTVEGVNYIKDMIQTTDEGKAFYKEHNVGSLKSWEIANLEGVNEHITNFFVEKVSKMLREYISAELKGPTGRYKDRLRKRYAKMEKVFMEDANDDKKDPADKAVLGAIPAMTWTYLAKHQRASYEEVYTKIAELDAGTITQAQFNTYFEGFAEFNRKMLGKYKMPLTSRRQVISKVNGKDVIYTKEAPNALTPGVNMIHGVDSAIFFKSHIDTVAEIEQILKDGKFNGEVLTRQEKKGFRTALQNASGMIHDANNADPYYNIIYDKHYRLNSVSISKDYDVEEQLAFTYASYYSKNGKGVNGEYDHTEAIDMLRASKENVLKKQAALDQIDETADKFFGYPDEIPKSDPKNIRPIPKKTTSTTGTGQEYNDDFLETPAGQAEIKASEQKNGVYEPTEHTHQTNDTERIARTEDDVGSNTMNWEDSQKTMDDSADELETLVNSGQAYWMMDLENTWSTDAAPLDDQTILEFYAEEFKDGSPTGNIIHHKYLPKYPEQYDEVTKGTEFQTYDYFRESGETDGQLSDNVGSKGDSKFYTDPGYQKYMKLISDELFVAGDSQNLVAFNGKSADFPLMIEQFGPILDGKTINEFDAMHLTMSVNKELSVKNKNSNRKLGDSHKRIKQGNRTIIKKSDEHTAKVDILMMNELMMHDLHRKKTGNVDEEFTQQELEQIIFDHKYTIQLVELDIQNDKDIDVDTTSKEKFIEELNDKIEAAKNGKPILSDDSTEVVTNRRGTQETLIAVGEAARADKTNIIQAFLDKYGMGSIDADEKSSYNDKDDVVYITNNADLTPEEMITQLLHEIAHQKTVGFVGANPNDVDVEYMRNSLERIKELGPEILAGITNPSIRRRIGNKIINEPNKARALIEMIAIMHAEPEVRDAFKDAIRSKSFSARVNRLMRKIVDYFKNRSGEIDMDKLMASIAETVRKGEIFNDTEQIAAKEGRAEIRRQLNSDAEIGYDAILYNNARTELLNANAYRRIKRKTKDDTFAEKKWRSANRITGIYTNQLLFNMIAPTSSYVGSLTHRYLKRKSTIYRESVKAIHGHWMGQGWLQSMKGYIDRARVGDLYALNLMEKMQMDAEQEMTSFEAEIITNIKELMKKAGKIDEDGNPVLTKKGKAVPITEEDITKIGHVVAYAPIFHLINDSGDWASILNSDDPELRIAELIDAIESDPNGLSKVMKDDALGIAKIVTKKELANTNNAYNVAQMNIADKAMERKVEQLVALYSLRMTDDVAQTIALLKHNKELADELGRVSKSLKVITDEVITGTTDKQAFRENIIYEQFEKPKEFRTFTEHTSVQKDYPYNAGWRILRHPTKKGYGVVYRNIDKTTIQTGAGTTENFKYYDVMVNEESKKVGKDIKGAVKVQNGTNTPYHKVVLTKEELEQVGDLVTDPADMLARAYAQMMMVKGTATVRNFILYGDKIKNLELQNDITKFNKKVGKMDNEKKPWFLKVPDSTDIEEFFKKNPAIARDYKVPEQISNIDDFGSNITLVRKDMHDMIQGYKDPVFFDNSTELKYLAYAVRQAVILIKQTWIMLNPEKVAADIASNQVILAAYGVPIKSVFKDQARAFKLSASMSKLRSGLVLLEFKIRAETDPLEKAKLENQRDIVVKKMEKHPMAPIYQNGMVQSMSTDILLKDRAVVTGLQNDVENLLNTILKNNSGDPSDVARAIQTFADMGISVDDVVKTTGNNLKKIKMLGDFGKRVGEAMKDSAGRVKKKKTDKDMAKFLSEFIGSPDSEILRIGSYMVTMADVASRYALYNHLRRNSGKIDISTKKKYRIMDEEEIVETVLEAFVDYKVNLPREIKVASDYGVLLFPSFWLRIQKIIYALAKDNPLKIAAAITLQEMLDVHIESYMDSNIFSKVGDIVNMPPVFTDPMDMLLPTKLIEQLSLGLIKF